MARAATPAPAGGPSGQEDAWPSFTLAMNVMRGSNLLAADITGSSDPYVVVHMGDPEESEKTKAIPPRAPRAGPLEAGRPLDGR